jgi:tetratricopeptide (TPR) repeat protein
MFENPSMKNGRKRTLEVIHPALGRKTASFLVFCFIAGGCGGAGNSKSDSQFSSSDGPSRTVPAKNSKDLAGPRNAVERYNQAQEKIREKSWPAAEASLRDAVSIAPNLVPAHLSLAEVYEKQNKKAEAAATYRKILEINPKHAESHLALGRLAEKTGQKERAIFHYEQVIQYNPDSFLAHYRLGLIRRQRKQIAMAVHHFSKAVHLSPEHQAARYWLWLSLSQRGGAQRREVELGRSLVEEGNETPVRYYRGVAARHFQAGRIEEALLAIQKAVDVNPQWRNQKWKGVLDDMARYRRAQGKAGQNGAPRKIVEPN